jgi:DNA-binding transcriptional LysR family regulator
MVEWLRDGRIDLAILYDIAGLSTVQAEPIVSEDLCLVSDLRSAPEGVDGAAPFDVLTTHPLVLPTVKHSLRKMVADCAHACDVTLDIAFEIDSLQSMIDATRQGLGWTVLPRSAIRTELEAGALHALTLSDPPLRRTLVTATAAQRGDAVLLHDLSRLVREQMLAVADLAGWRPLKSSSGAPLP